MRYPFVGLLLVFLTLWTGLSAAAERVPAIILSDDGSAFEASSDVGVWLEPGRQATVDQLAKFSVQFNEASQGAQHEMRVNNTLWIKLRLRRAPAARQMWTLNIPVPFIDSVVLYQADRNGIWSAQYAGNQLPQTKWSKHSLYPEFDVTVEPGSDHDIYLQVRNFKNLSIPLRFAPTTQRDTQRLSEFMVIGVVLGCLVSLALLSLLRFAEHRNRVDLLAFAYSIAITLTIAAMNGVTGTLLPSDTLFWSTYSQTALPPITVGLALLLLRDLYAISTRHRRYDVVLIYTACSAMASTLSLLLLDRALAHLVIALVTFFAACIGLIGAHLSWRFRSS
ncbi:MAG: hypothetical protein H7293_04555, partial [Candidatus Saccharibacteria bacterium]|nr:hypothetical protein [Rhodoferax sp.]